MPLAGSAYARVGLGFNLIEITYGAGDGNRTNSNEPNKGVTTRFSVQLESNGVKSDWLLENEFEGQDNLPAIPKGGCDSRNTESTSDWSESDCVDIVGGGIYVQVGMIK